MSNKSIIIGNRAVGIDHPPFVVAEISANHNGNLDRALAIIKAAKNAGADAVKFQTYTANTLTIDHDGPGFRIESGLWQWRRLFELYHEAHTPWEWHARLFEYARELDIIAFSSAFDATSVAFLQRLNVPAYKIASFELVDLPLIEDIARTGKPIILSTGLATRYEIADAVSAARSAGAADIALLHCVSRYPTPASEMNLRTLQDLARTHHVVCGISDHSLGIAASVAAVALGAAIIEKHFTLRRSDGGPDCAFSLEPDELRRLAEDCRTAWEALGRVHYEEVPSEELSKSARRSLYVVVDIRKGEKFTRDNVRSIRPGFGLAPKHLPEVVGQTATRDLLRGTPLDWSMVK